ncbi:ADP-glyceromanno-heptose 6-epimerase [Veillonellaceae bacterium WCA-693-APC-5D-A]|uniref:ADP-L-glycero-D-manno-heptose-6-epimerase n=1 Tax=Anaerovibrio slackiae TaxID=2652309 RepID=A0A6I2UFM5_9FIRM|nr:ADP-glyceromanno-heptose 6-epimerase [Anaerovibrio slackiae]MSU07576.1 ADP-glyceromanno-heptose 6-epimerase [Anaerovibrio slackiae]
MYIVTGGAGFIGSCVVRMLNDMGIQDIVIVDHISATDKWKNMCNKSYLEYINRDEFLGRLDEFAGKVSHVIHMGACSATTERDFDFLYKNNFEYSKKLWNFCAENEISFIYASSAATYGDGSHGFDDKGDIKALQPLNGYGYSKQLFDLWAEKQISAPKQHVGFKFFNVYGPNEYFKGSMASVIFHTFNSIKRTGRMGLFKSYKEGIKDGQQLRDFVYVKDICNVIKYMLEHPEINGLFNLGTGVARSFYDLAVATFAAMGRKPEIDFIDMPEHLRGKYQYFTQANMEKLRAVGYEASFYTLDSGVEDYVCDYLMKDYAVY